MTFKYLPNKNEYLFVTIIIITITLSVVVLGLRSELNRRLKYSPTSNNTDTVQNSLEQMSRTSSFNAVEFLSMIELPENAVCNTVCSVTFPLYSDDNAAIISEDDVRDLMPHIYSTKKSRPVCSVLSSYIPNEQLSTVGIEAMFLIEGYKKGFYPPGLCSIGSSLVADEHMRDADNYKRWFIDLLDQKVIVTHSVCSGQRDPVSEVKLYESLGISSLKQISELEKANEKMVFHLGGYHFEMLYRKEYYYISTYNNYIEIRGMSNSTYDGTYIDSIGLSEKLGMLTYSTQFERKTY